MNSKIEKILNHIGDDFIDFSDEDVRLGVLDLYKVILSAVGEDEKRIMTSFLYKNKNYIKTVWKLSPEAKARNKVRQEIRDNIKRLFGV